MPCPDSPGRLTIAILDEIRVCRDALAAALGGDSDVHVIASAPDPRSLQSVITSAPSVVVLNGSQRSPVDAIRRIRVGLPSARIVAFGVSEPDEVILKFAQQGAIALAGSEAAVADLLRLVRALAGDANEDELSSVIRMMATLLWRDRPPLRSDLTIGVPDELTPRERNVLALVAAGQSNKQIAAELHLTVATVKTHVHNVLTKMHAVGRSELVARFGGLQGTGM